LIDRRIFLLLASLSAFAPLAIDLYLPSFAAMTAGLNTTFDQVQRTVSVFLAGFALGMLIYGPISDRFGRRRVILIGAGVFTLASIACTLTQSIEQLQLFRLFQALGGGAATVVARATVRDLFDEREGAKALALIAITTSLAPLVAPVAGAYILQLGSWRWEFATLTLFGLACWVATFLMLPESLQAENAQTSILKAFKAYWQVLVQPQSIWIVLSGALLFAAMFSYITAIPFVYVGFHGLSEKSFGLLFGMNITSLMILGYISSRIVKNTGTLRIIRMGSIVSLTGACLVGLGTYPTEPSTSALVLTASGLFLGVGALGFIAPNSTARLLTTHKERAGAASAVYGCAQFGLGALASATTAAWHDGTARPMGTLFVTLALASALCSLMMKKHAGEA
jgi:MFS transporter, DHA1 family, multidrug resistance protein